MDILIIKANLDFCLYFNFDHTVAQEIVSDFNKYSLKHDLRVWKNIP